MLGLAVFTLVSGAADPLRRRLRLVQGDGQATAGSAQTLGQLVDSTAPYLLPKNDRERTRTRDRLIHAGYRSPTALTVFYALKMLLGVAIPIAVFILARYFPHGSSLQVATAAAAGGLIGMLLPNGLLRRQVEKRQRRLYEGFPDALDMLVVCVESGLGLNAAIDRVAEELDVSHPDLAEELALVNAEIRVGVERIQALRNLADRTGMDDIRGLVALLAQSIRFGTSVADTLRVYSEEFRDKRMQRAEEIAAKMGTKMIFPMVLFLFPGFFVVAVGPAILGVLKALGKI
jgi:tight adherence protein C